MDSGSGSLYAQHTDEDLDDEIEGVLRRIDELEEEDRQVRDSNAQPENYSTIMRLHESLEELRAEQRYREDDDD